MEGRGGGETSEPLGEGVEADYVDYIVDGIDDGGGGPFVDFLLFCQNPDFFNVDLGLETRILTPSRVEMIGKTTILCLETTTNR